MQHQSPIHGSSSHGTRRNGGAVALLLLLGTIPLLSGCSATTQAEAKDKANAAGLEAVKVVKVGKANEITLTPKAAERLGMKTATVVVGPTDGQLAVPHSSLLYDPDGKTFVYTSPKELVFKRADVSVLRITGGTVVLTTGPALGTAVVTVGAAELFGVDTGVGGAH